MDACLSHIRQCNGVRHDLMLKMLPKHPGKIDCGTIWRRLREEHDIVVEKRSVERDLRAFEARHEIFPVVSDDHKPVGWSWAKDAAIMDIPGMDVSTAVTFRLLASFLSHMLPKSVLKNLKPYEDRAREVLAAFAGVPMAAWPGKVRVITRSQPLIPARIRPEVLDAVYEALLVERQLQVSYRKAGAAKPADYVLHPLGLVFRDAVVYLICTSGDHDNVLEFLLHRMQSAAIIDERRRVPEGFDLDEFINKSGGLGICCDEKPVKVKLLLHTDVARSLSETPMSADQSLKDMPDGRVLLEATVPDTLTLRSWILSYGDGMEVVGSASLRRDVRDAIAKTHALYRSG